MKSDCKKNNGNVSESRKIRKPLMEKKRRARINDSLETLKQMLLDSKTALKESSNNKSMQRTAKLEKADILEMTVTYLQHLRSKIDQNPLRVSGSTKAKEVVAIRPADSSCDGLKMGVTLVPTRLHNGGIAFVPAKLGSTMQQNISHNQLDTSHNVWRPW